MPIYRTVIVGARRGLHHARAYRGMGSAQVVALCEIDRERLSAGVQEMGVRGYADYEEMLAQEQPDIVHAVTMPSLPRAPWVAPAARAGVKALVIEKPLALRPAEADALRAVAAQHPQLKIIVNHQRRYMTFADKLRTFQADGRLDKIHFVRASTQGGIMDMATHLMDVVLLALGDDEPTHVWASVEGSECYRNPNLLCPDNLIAVYTFRSGARVFFESARQALGANDFEGSNPRCNVDLWAERGRFWWRENGTWGYQLDGESFCAPSQFNDDDLPAQRRFTQVIVDWLDDERAAHHCRLELALRGFDAVMTAYRSALLGRRIACEERLTDAEWEELRRKLQR